MPSPAVNRFEWAKAVLGSQGLNSRAKTVTAVLALKFANDATGQLNPKVATIAEASGASPDTVKRAISDLVKGKWLHRTEGRGRGNATVYTLRSKATIVALERDEKKGQCCTFNWRKGCNAAPKRGQCCTFPYRTIL